MLREESLGGESIEKIQNRTLLTGKGTPTAPSVFLRRKEKFRPALGWGQ